MTRLSNWQLFALVLILSFTLSGIVARIVQGYWFYSN